MIVRKVQEHFTNPGAGYPDQLGPSGKLVGNSTQPTFFEITGYRIK
jgi:hypothetical protein